MTVGKMQALFLNGQIKDIVNFCKQTSPPAPHNDWLPSAISEFMNNNIMLFSCNASFKISCNVHLYLLTRPTVCCQATFKSAKTHISL